MVHTETLTQIHPVKQRILDIWGGEPQSFDELCECVIKVANYHESRKEPKNQLIGFACEYSYNSQVAATHSTPLGYRTRWRDPEKFPALTGRVWLRYAQERDIDQFGALTLVHTGTGGFGGYSGPWQGADYHYFVLFGHEKHRDQFHRPVVYGYDSKIWLEDWPAIASDIEQEILASRLKGQDRIILKYRYEWSNDWVKEHDQLLFAKGLSY